MSRMTRKNRCRIKARFEEKTGVALTPKKTFPMRKMVALIAAVMTCLVLAGFTYPLFTPLEGDELSLKGTYEGNGIVSVYVENRSGKPLNFQAQTKLMNWLTAEEVASTGGKAVFDNTKFPPRSSGVMTIDLSKAYDMEALEHPEHNSQWYYLLLTNNGFLFGHDWICSVDFDREKEALEETEQISSAAEALEDREEELRFYFEDSYQGEVAGLNEQNFLYLQKVDELIKRFDGDVVHPVYPLIPVSGPATMPEPNPQLRTGKGLAADSEWKIIDGYGRLVGADTFEKALTVMAQIPSRLYPETISAVPLIYTFIYEADAVREEAYAFVYGRFLSFREMEAWKVYEDEYYRIYDMTDCFYTDLDAYLDFLQETRSDLKIDEQVRREIHQIYDECRTHLGEWIYYQN